MNIINDLIESGEYPNTIGKEWVQNLNLFKPIWYFNKEDCKTISYRYYRDRGYTKLWQRFASNYLEIRDYICKEGTFLAGAGSLFFKENALFDNYISLFLVCEDKKKVVFLVNHKVNEFKGIKTKVANYIKSNPWKADVIWTDNPDSYCFKTEPEVRFKTFIDQKAYYQHIADEWLASQKAVKKKEEKQPELAF